MIQVHVDRGSYKPPSITIVLVGPSKVDTLWALHLLCVKIPFDVRWKVTAYQGEESANRAIQDWKQNDDTDLLLVWPEGQFLSWNSIIGITRSIYPAEVGRARVYARDGREKPTVRDELTSSPEEFGNSHFDSSQEIDPQQSLAVCVPSLGSTSMVWAHSMLRLMPPLGVVAYLRACLGYSVPEARERLVDGVLSLNPQPKWLLFLGDDNVSPPTGVHRLMDIALGMGLTAVGGLYRNKIDPPSNVAWRGQRTIRQYLDYELGDVIEVGGMGLDFCLLSTEDLAKIEKPLFKNVMEEDEWLTEDAYFWNKYHETLGKRPFVITDLVIGHYDLKTERMF